MPDPQQPAATVTPYEHIRAQIAEVIVAVVKAEIPVTQAEFTAAFLSAAAEGAILQRLSLDQFNELATHFYKEAQIEMAAAAVPAAAVTPVKPVPQ